MLKQLLYYVNYGNKKREVGNIREKQLQLLEVKTYKPKVKILPDEVNNKLDTAGEMKLSMIYVILIE